MYSEKKTTQMAAFFIKREGGKVNYLKLTKLLYLAERQAIARWGDSMSGDSFASLKLGPVLSRTLDITKGNAPTTSPWGELINRQNFDLFLKRELTADDRDELSPAEEKILDAVFAEFGHMSEFELANHTHEICPEWRDPKGSSFPIQLREILQAVGKHPDHISALMEFSEEQARLEDAKARLL